MKIPNDDYYSSAEGRKRADRIATTFQPKNRVSDHVNYVLPPLLPRLITLPSVDCSAKDPPSIRWRELEDRAAAPNTFMVSILPGKGDGTMQRAVNLEGGCNPVASAAGEFGTSHKADLAVVNPTVDGTDTACMNWAGAGRKTVPGP